MLRILAGFSVSAALLVGAASPARADACMCAPDANVTLPGGARAFFVLSDDDVRREEPLGGDVLWCIDGDDPRCAPVGGQDSDPTRSVSTSSPSGALADDAVVPDTGAHDVRYELDVGGPRQGVRYRIERPPR